MYPVLKKIVISAFLVFVVTKTMIQLRKHKYYSHGEKSENTFTCPSCDRLFWRKEVLAQHMFQHSEGKQYKCSECDYSSKTPKTLKSHIIFKHSDQPSVHQCKLCSKFFSKSSHLRDHLRTHRDKHPFKCKQCNYSSAHRKALDKHLLCVHSNERPYKCTQCDYATKRADSLKAHMYQHTGGKPKPFLCEICSRTFAQIGVFRNHQTVHMEVKPHKCKLCSYTCRDPSMLASHMYKHTNDSPYKCDKCDYVSATASSLKLHSGLHTGVKPKKCPECEYTCRDNRALVKHMLTHSGEVSLKCPECPYTCRNQTTLRKHIAWHSRRKVHARGGRGSLKAKTDSAPNTKN